MQRGNNQDFRITEEVDLLAAENIRFWSRRRRAAWLQRHECPGKYLFHFTATGKCRSGEFSELEKVSLCKILKPFLANQWPLQAEEWGFISTSVSGAMRTGRQCRDFYLLNRDLFDGISDNSETFGDQNYSSWIESYLVTVQGALTCPSFKKREVATDRSILNNQHQFRLSPQTEELADPILSCSAFINDSGIPSDSMVNVRGHSIAKGVRVTVSSMNEFFSQRSRTASDGDQSVELKLDDSNDDSSDSSSSSSSKVSFRSSTSCTSGAPNRLDTSIQENSNAKDSKRNKRRKRRKVTNSFTSDEESSSDGSYKPRVHLNRIVRRTKRIVIDSSSDESDAPLPNPIPETDLTEPSSFLSSRLSLFAGLEFLFHSSSTRKDPTMEDPDNSFLHGWDDIDLAQQPAEMATTEYDYLMSLDMRPCIKQLKETQGQLSKHISKIEAFLLAKSNLMRLSDYLILSNAMARTLQHGQLAVCRVLLKRLEELGTRDERVLPLENLYRDHDDTLSILMRKLERDMKSLEEESSSEFEDFVSEPEMNSQVTVTELENPRTLSTKYTKKTFPKSKFSQKERSNGGKPVNHEENTSILAEHELLKYVNRMTTKVDKALTAGNKKQQERLLSILEVNITKYRSESSRSKETKVLLGDLEDLRRKLTGLDSDFENSSAEEDHVDTRSVVSVESGRSFDEPDSVKIDHESNLSPPQTTTKLSKASTSKRKLRISDFMVTRKAPHTSKKNRISCELDSFVDTFIDNKASLMERSIDTPKSHETTRNPSPSQSPTSSSGVWTNPLMSGFKVRRKQVASKRIRADLPSVKHRLTVDELVAMHESSQGPRKEEQAQSTHTMICQRDPPRYRLKRIEDYSKYKKMSERIMIPPPWLSFQVGLPVDPLHSFALLFRLVREKIDATILENAKTTISSLYSYAQQRKRNLMIDSGVNQKIGLWIKSFASMAGDLAKGTGESHSLWLNIQIWVILEWAELVLPTAEQVVLYMILFSDFAERFARRRGEVSEEDFSLAFHLAKAISSIERQGKPLSGFRHQAIWVLLRVVVTPDTFFENGAELSVEKRITLFSKAEAQTQRADVLKSMLDLMKEILSKENRQNIPRDKAAEWVELIWDFIFLALALNQACGERLSDTSGEEKVQQADQNSIVCELLTQVFQLTPMNVDSAHRTNQQYIQQNIERWTETANWLSEGLSLYDYVNLLIDRFYATSRVLGNPCIPFARFDLFWESFQILSNSLPTPKLPELTERFPVLGVTARQNILSFIPSVCKLAKTELEAAKETIAFKRLFPSLQSILRGPAFLSVSLKVEPVSNVLFSPRIQLFRGTGENQVKVASYEALWNVLGLIIAMGHAIGKLDSTVKGSVSSLLKGFGQWLLKLLGDIDRCDNVATHMFALCGFSLLPNLRDSESGHSAALGLISTSVQCTFGFLSRALLDIFDTRSSISASKTVVVEEDEELRTKAELFKFIQSLWIRELKLVKELLHDCSEDIESPPKHTFIQELRLIIKIIGYGLDINGGPALDFLSTVECLSLLLSLFRSGVSSPGYPKLFEQFYSEDTFPRFVALDDSLAGSESEPKIFQKGLTQSGQDGDGDGDGEEEEIDAILSNLDVQAAVKQASQKKSLKEREAALVQIQNAWNVEKEKSVKWSHEVELIQYEAVEKLFPPLLGLVRKRILHHEGNTFVTKVKKKEFSKFLELSASASAWCVVAKLYGNRYPGTDSKLVDLRTQLLDCEQWYGTDLSRRTFPVRVLSNLFDAIFSMRILDSVQLVPVMNQIVQVWVLAALDKEARDLCTKDFLRFTQLLGEYGLWVLATRRIDSFEILVAASLFAVKRPSGSDEKDFDEYVIERWKAMLDSMKEWLKRSRVEKARQAMLSENRRRLNSIFHFAAKLVRSSKFSCDLFKLAVQAFKDESTLCVLHGPRDGHALYQIAERHGFKSNDPEFLLHLLSCSRTFSRTELTMSILDKLAEIWDLAKSEDDLHRFSGIADAATLEHLRHPSMSSRATQFLDRWSEWLVKHQPQGYIQV